MCNSNFVVGVPSFSPHRKCVKGRNVQKAKAMVVETNGEEEPVCLGAKDIGCFAFLKFYLNVARVMWERSYQSSCWFLGSQVMSLI